MEWTGIAIHHSATPDDGGHKDTTAIRRYHKEERNWSDIGYNGLVESVDGEYQYVNGRGTETVGAHVKGHNGYLLGLCFVGNFNQSVPNAEMIDTGASVLFNWMNNYDIKMDRIKGHREWAQNKTLCPGDRFPMDRLKREIREIWYKYLSNNSTWSTKLQQRAMDTIGIDAGPIDGLNGRKTELGTKKASVELLNENRNTFTKSLRRAILNKLKNDFLEKEG